MTFYHTALVAVLLAVGGSASAFVPNPEFEPNESKATATIAASGGSGMAHGDTITGTTTGTATSTPGIGSADYFRVRTAPQPAGIYRHRLTLTTTGTAGHTGQIRGLTQNTSGAIVPGTDLLLQASTTSTTPARFNQWYGFGRQEELYYRVQGAAATTQPYAAELTTEPVTPLNISGTLQSGVITITTPPSNPSANTALWVYDAALEPIPGFSSEDPAAPSTSSIASLTRVFVPGTYYLAFSTRFLSNNLVSAQDDRFRSTPLMDFPGSIANSSAAVDGGASNNFPISLTHAGGTLTVTGTRRAYDIVWVRFQVASPVQPTPIVVTPRPSNAVRQASPLSTPPFIGTLAAFVAPGDTPVSTGLLVRANLSAFGGPAAAVMADDGISPDPIAGDGVYTAAVDVTTAAAATYEIPVTATDAQGRSTTAPVPLRVRDGVIPLGTLSSGGTLVGTGEIEPRGIQWFSFTPAFDAVSPRGWIDMFTEIVPGSNVNFPVLGIFDVGGNLLAQDEIDGLGSTAAISFGQVNPARPGSGDGEPFNGRDGSLVAGQTYYLAVTQYRQTFTSPFGATSAGNVAGAVRVFISGQANTGLAASPEMVPSLVAVGGPSSPESLLKVTVAGALAPASTGITVTANLSTIGGGSAVTVLDNGQDDDAVAGDGIYTLRVSAAGQSAGLKVLPVTTSDAQGRAVTTQVTLNVRGDTLVDLSPIIMDGVQRQFTRQVTGQGADWYRIELPAINADSWLDVFSTATANVTTNTSIALFRENGTVRYWTFGFQGAAAATMSFGQTSPARVYPPLPPLAGEQGDLPAGVYYLVYLPFTGTSYPTVSDGFGVELGNDTPAAVITLSIAGFAPVRCLADVAADGTIDGSDFIAFINAFGIGDAAVDPVADVGGGSDPSRDAGGPDGTIDGTDFIAFINAFAAGC
jgi:hypothetical protein